MPLGGPGRRGSPLPSALEDLALRLLHVGRDACLRVGESGPYLNVRVPGSKVGVSVFHADGEFRVSLGPDASIALGADPDTAAMNIAELCTMEGIARALRDAIARAEPGPAGQ